MMCQSSCFPPSWLTPLCLCPSLFGLHQTIYSILSLSWLTPLHLHPSLFDLHLSYSGTAVLSRFSLSEPSGPLSMPPPHAPSSSPQVLKFHLPLLIICAT